MDTLLAMQYFNLYVMDVKARRSESILNMLHPAIVPLREIT